MPYSGIAFSQLRQELANRLNDPNMVFWVDAELGIYIQDAMRFWNILTGDNKTYFTLPVSSSDIWYDMNLIDGSPRLATLQDSDIYSRLQYMLLEPQAADAALLTAQFSTDDLVMSVQRKRDEFIFKTGCTATVESLGITPGYSQVVLPQEVIQVLRSYWMPVDVPGANPYPIYKSDAYANHSYQPFAVSTPSQPWTYSVGVAPPLILELYPPANIPGNVECITIESQGQLSADSPQIMYMPNDFIPGLQWGALADLLSISAQAQDLPRAAYARQRFQEYVSLIGQYPFIFEARVNGLQVYADAVEVLDKYNPYWEVLTENPSIIGLSGQNLIAYPTSLPSSNIVLWMCANANVPSLDSDYIQLGDEVLDAILDEAQSVAMFKTGGAEASAAGELHANIIKLAAQRNAKQRAQSIFRDILYGIAQREVKIAPLEVVTDEQQ